MKERQKKRTVKFSSVTEPRTWEDEIQGKPDHSGQQHARLKEHHYNLVKLWHTYHKDKDIHNVCI